MFQLEESTAVVLTSVNNRAEMHGDDKVPAVDLGFRWETSNAVLGRFDPWLLTALYHRSAAADAQGDIPGVEKVMQNLRMSKLGAPLHWQEELIGYFLEIDYGTGGNRNLRLDAVDVNKFKFTPKEGGTTIVEFRVQASTNITERIFGKLPFLQGHEVKITLMAPKVEGAQTQEQPTLQLAGDPQPDKPLTPEDVFTAGVVPGTAQQAAA